MVNCCFLNTNISGEHKGFINLYPAVNSSPDGICPTLSHKYHTSTDETLEWNWVLTSLLSGCRIVFNCLIFQSSSFAKSSVSASLVHKQSTLCQPNLWCHPDTTRHFVENKLQPVLADGKILIMLYSRCWLAQMLLTFFFIIIVIIIIVVDVVLYNNNNYYFCYYYLQYRETVCLNSLYLYMYTFIDIYLNAT